MTMPATQKIRYSLVLIVVAILVTMPDVLFDFLLGMAQTLFNFILDSIHTAVEAIEYVLDILIEHLFHTDLQQTQLIVFYILLLMGLGVSYGLVKSLVRLFRWSKDMLFSLWIEEQTLFSIYWLNISLTNKIKVIAVIAILGYLFFLMSF